MGKLSDKIDLGDAVQEAISKMNGAESDAVESLLDSGVKATKKRSREKPVKDKFEPGTEDVPIEENSLFAELIPQEKQEDVPQEEKWPKTYEETCEYDLRRAHEMGYEDPDFDFRQEYVKGQHLWFVRVHVSLGIKELLEVVVQTVYPRTIIAVQPKAFCHCIGYKMQHQIFRSQSEALAYYESVKVSTRYMDEKPKKKRKGEDDDEDADDEVDTSESYEMMMKGREEDE